jgi:hypothetical protein
MRIWIRVHQRRIVRLSLDDQYVPNPDEESIAIEAESHGNYDLWFGA